MEKWKPAFGYEDYYEVSDHGNVRRIGIAGNLSKTINQDGYYCVGLYRAPGSPVRRIHRIVALTFIGGSGPVNHKDRNRKNNHVSNLEFVNWRENVTYGYKVYKKMTGAFKVPSGKWISRIKHGKSHVNLGTYNTEKEAHMAYMKYIRDNNIENRYAS